MALDIREWLRVLLAFGPANYDIWRCIDKKDIIGSFGKFLDNAENPYAVKYKSVSYMVCEQWLSYCEKNNIGVISFEDKRYPKLLKEIADPPCVLFVYGNAECLNRPSAAIVGARNCCDYTRRVTSMISAELAARNINVVSGFARGTDTAAHTAAINAGGVTVAVLGSGIFYDYPKNTMELKRKIAQNGAVISELLPNSEPARGNFKIRNRIISGLCKCVAVVEASQISGSLNTASHAAEQGREVFVVPPRDITSESFRGQTSLLRDGAAPLYGIEDIFDYFENDCFL